MRSRNRCSPVPFRVAKGDIDNDPCVQVREGDYAASVRSGFHHPRVARPVHQRAWCRPEILLYCLPSAVNLRETVQPRFVVASTTYEQLDLRTSGHGAALNFNRLPAAVNPISWPQMVSSGLTQWRPPAR